MTNAAGGIAFRQKEPGSSRDATIRRMYSTVVTYPDILTISEYFLLPFLWPGFALSKLGRPNAQLSR
jgi:hypothetical protein